jgi:hypothetical protein
MCLFKRRSSRWGPLVSPRATPAVHGQWSVAVRQGDFRSREAMVGSAGAIGISRTDSPGSTATDDGLLTTDHSRTGRWNHDSTSSPQALAVLNCEHPPLFLHAGYAAMYIAETVRLRTLHTTPSLASGGTIRGGSFLSSALVAARMRRWFFTIGSLPSPF